MSRRHGWTVLFVAGLLAWVAVSRAAYLCPAPLMSKDGPLYIDSLELGPNYCVPMPGNLGYVLLARGAMALTGEAKAAFAVVNGLLTMIGALHVYGLAVSRIGRALAAACAFALTCNPLVWWHGETINSYLVWLAVLPAVGFHGIRLLERREAADLVACSLAFGIGTMLRQDLLAFAGPLWFVCVAFSRPGWRGWLVALAIAGVCNLAWFGGMSAILGGPDVYLARVQAKHAAHMEGFSPAHRGLFEGLARNGVKLALFLAWAVPLVGPLAMAGLSGLFQRRESTAGGKKLPAWALAGLGVIGVAPALAFSLFVFAGNAGLTFPLLPVIYLAAAAGAARWLGGEGQRWPALGMLGLGLASLVQFAAAPILPETDQRHVILNVTFLRYSGPGLTARLDGNLDDYGIDPSLQSVMRQLRRPEAVPGRLAHLHGLWQIQTRQGAALARRYRLPHIITAHGMADPWALRQKAFKKRLYTALVEGKNLQRADCLHALSRREIGHYRALAPRTPVALVPNGVDVRPFDDLPNRAVLEAEYPALRERFVLLFYGRLHRKKGLDLLAEALPRLVRDGQPVHLLLAGRDDGAWEPFRQRMRAEGLEERITYVGHVAGEAARRVWAAADAFVLPSYSEGFSMAVLEALACRLPALITSACYFPEAARAGAAVEVEASGEAVLGGLRVLLDQSAQERAEMGRLGRELVERSYTWHQQALRLAEVYAWMQHGGPRPRAIREAEEAAESMS